MRNFGHARTTRTERPDSVNDLYERDYPCEVPFRKPDDSEKLTRGQAIVLCICGFAALVFGGMVAHGYYIWFLK